MKKTVLTIKELAERWGRSEKTIREYVQNGELSTCKGPLKYCFNLSYIEKFEQCENQDPMSALERKKLLSKIEKLECENEKYKRAWAQMQVIAIQTSF